MMAGLSLFQLGEFGFILAMPGLEFGLLSERHYQIFLSVAILSMGATPFMLEYADRIVRRTFLSFVPVRVAKRMDRLVRVRKEQDRVHAKVMRDHLVIIGFGLNGQNVASSAINSGVNCTVIEEDPDLAAKARKIGLVVLVGDASNVHLLEQAHVERARVVVVAISDATVSRSIVAAVRTLSTAAHVIVRTRYVREMQAAARCRRQRRDPGRIRDKHPDLPSCARIPGARAIGQCTDRPADPNDHYGLLRGTGNRVRRKEETLTIRIWRSPPSR
jgi:CPA2 family monovalent cation:H+ antiporter-2